MKGWFLCETDGLGAKNKLHSRQGRCFFGILRIQTDITWHRKGLYVHEVLQYVLLCLLVRNPSQPNTNREGRDKSQKDTPTLVPPQKVFFRRTNEDSYPMKMEPSGFPLVFESFEVKVQNHPNFKHIAQIIFRRPGPALEAFKNKKQKPKTKTKNDRKPNNKRWFCFVVFLHPGGETKTRFWTSDVCSQALSTPKSFRRWKT